MCLEQPPKAGLEGRPPLPPHYGSPPPQQLLVGATLCLWMERESGQPYLQEIIQPSLKTYYANSQHHVLWQ